MNGLPPTTSTSTTPPAINSGKTNSTALTNTGSVTAAQITHKTPISDSFLVKQSIPLDQSQIQQLKQLSPNLFTQLQQQAQAQIPSQNLNQNQNRLQTVQPTLYFNRLSGDTQNLNIISTVELLKGSLLTLTKDSKGQWLTNPKELVQASLQQLLRQLIPQQPLQNLLSTASPSHLLKTLNQLIQLPSNTQSQLLTPQVQKQIGQLLHSEGIIQASANTNSTQIKESIQLSQGLLSANKTMASDIKTALDNLQKMLGTETNKPSLLHHLEQTDKRNLAQLLQPIFSSTISRENSVHIQQPVTRTDALLTLLGLKVSKDISQNQQQLKDTVRLKLMQAIHSSKENSLLNQIRSLSGDLNSQESNGARMGTLNCDIPIRWGEQLIPMQLSIQEKLEQENEKSDMERSKDAVRRWQVFLSLELPDSNTLHTQFTLIQENISVILWTESDQLSENIKTHLHELRNNLSEQGLTVEDLTCFKGTPPNAHNRIDYNLIDIKT